MGLASECRRQSLIQALPNTLSVPKKKIMGGRRMDTKIIKGWHNVLENSLRKFVSVKEEKKKLEKNKADRISPQRTVTVSQILQGKILLFITIWWYKVNRLVKKRNEHLRLSQFHKGSYCRVLSPGPFIWGKDDPEIHLPNSFMALYFWLYWWIILTKRVFVS